MKPIKVIFLDFDGVLNTDDFIDSADLHRPESLEEKASLDSLDLKVSNSGHDPRVSVRHIDARAVSYLNSIIEKTGAKVVISSAWRKFFYREALASILKHHGFIGEIIGLTPITFSYLPRSSEISRWISNHREEVLEGSATYEVVNFVILDDLPEAGTNYPDNFVLTKFYQGLSAEDAEKAVRILNS